MGSAIGLSMWTSITIIGLGEGANDEETEALLRWKPRWLGNRTCEACVKTACEMESTSGRELVTVASLDYGVSQRGDAEADSYAMAKDPVDYTEEWGASRVVEGDKALSCTVLTQYYETHKFKRKEYTTPDMAIILKATTTVKARALKPGSSGAKEVRGRVERLSKDSTPKASEEGVSQRQERPKEPWGKEKVPEEAKRRKLVHVTSSSKKFGTLVSHEAKSTSEPKLLASASKAIKLEMVREAEAEEAREEAARRAAEAAEEEAAKQKPVREKGKSPSFLAGREETLATALVEALSQEVRSATESFYRFWTDRWQLHASSYDATDLTRALVSQSVRTFSLALECREALSDFQTRTQSSEEKTASLAKELKAARAEAEEARAPKLEEMVKLESALAQIEALKKEVHESQYEVASLTKKVEVSNEHQKVTAEALEKANLSLVGAQEANRFLETQLKWYVDDASHDREEAVQEYVANFHNTEEYKSFSAYWRNFAYAEVMERAEELYPNLDLTQLRSEFVDEVPQTPAEEVQENNAAEVEETNADAQVVEAPSTERLPHLPRLRLVFFSVFRM
ncbi:uncharacterized protein LOC111366926 [Olea europaea var. sylvestris]|uniref:uncharacterized protein LOC111366926 n=1 Tax=Olea europaea var. sylvestris TaxID=158386 RepID=UPI000C1D1429|nr:uncharacterized protein LOC111366926 [Olea europaea var. sylvestris]